MRRGLKVLLLARQLSLEHFVCVQVKFGQRLRWYLVTAVGERPLRRDIVHVELPFGILTLELRHLKKVVGRWRDLLWDMLSFLTWKNVGHAQVPRHRASVSVECKGRSFALQVPKVCQLVLTVHEAVPTQLIHIGVEHVVRLWIRDGHETLWLRIHLIRILGAFHHSVHA
jgi:hypothetical protein